MEKVKKCVSKRALVIILVVCIVLSYSILIPTVANAAVTLSVDTNTVIQSNFLGIGGVYHGFAYMPESNDKGYNDTLRNVEFSRVADMNLHLARTWYRADWACGQSGYPSYDWNSTKMTAFYNWLQAMKDRNVDVAINTAWWCTNDVYNVYPFSNADPSTWSTRVNQWAAWMSESLNQIINVRGFTNVKYLILFTEPNYESGTLPTGYTQWQAFKEACNTLNNKLVADGRRSLVKLVGPNSSAYSLGNAPAELNDVIDIYTAHGYNYTGYTEWYNNTVSIKNEASSTGKPIWVDEYGKGNEDYRNTAYYGNYIAQANAAFLNAGAQSSQIWLLFDQQYTWPLDTLTNGDSFNNGVHKWGTANFLPDSQFPRPSYYAFSLMSKYMGGPGTQVYSTTNGSGVYIAATKQPSGDWSYLVVNGNESAQDIIVNLSDAINKNLYRYLYDPNTITPDSNATIIGYDKTFSSVSTSFSDNIPSMAVVVYSSIQGNPSPTPVPPSPPITAYSENFDSGLAQGWAGESGGTWAVESNEYSGTNTSSVGGAHYDTSNFDNFTYKVNGRFIGSTTGDMYARFRWQNSNNFYQLYLSRASGYQYLRLYKCVNGTYTQIGTEAAYDPPVDTNLSFNISVNGSNINATVSDGTNTKTVSATDSTFTSGKIGLGINKSHVHFDNVAVTPVYSENFDSGLAQGWAVDNSGGTWAVEGNEYSGTNTSSVGGAHYDTSNFSNFTYSVNGRFIGSTAGDMYARFRWQDSNNFYQVYLSKASGYQYLRLYKCANGTYTQIGTEAAYDPPVDTNLNFNISVNGSNINATVSDGINTKTVSATDSTFTSGKIGLGINKSHVHFDNVAVTPVYSENFDSGLAQGWSVDNSGGTWAVESNEYSGTNTSSVGGAHYDTSNFSNFTYSVNGRFIGSTTGDMYARFRWQDSNNFYQVYLSKASGYQYLRLYKCVNGTYTQIGTEAAYDPPVDTNLNFNISVNVSNINATVSDGINIKTVSATDSTFTSGKIGLGINRSHVHFDNVEVY